MNRLQNSYLYDKLKPIARSIRAYTTHECRSGAVRDGMDGVADLRDGAFRSTAQCHMQTSCTR